MAPRSKPRSVYWWVSIAMTTFGVAMLAALAIQNFSSQHLIEHRFWVGLLDSVSADHAARIRAGEGASLPHEGLVRSWYTQGEGPVPDAPSYLRNLPPGAYSTENGYGVFMTDEAFSGRDSFHALVVDLAPGRLVTEIAIEELEGQQNRYSVLSTVWALVVALLIGGLIAWLHANLVRPVRDLAERMRAIEPRDKGARLPTDYKREEIQVIAQASNAHLDRVEQFMARERSLLDQASHEFRTPIAVIAGAVDVLHCMPLADAAKPVLARIEHAVGDLSETMVALLYLAREPVADARPADVTALHELLPRLVRDHEHLLRDKDARLHAGVLEPTFVAVPEAMLRIAISNLVRNAVENTGSGSVELSLAGGVVTVTDSGRGFDPVEAARRYRDSLRNAAPTRGQGLGLFLIGRICERFGWTLSIDPGAHGGTQARLDVGASVIRT